MELVINIQGTAVLFILIVIAGGLVFDDEVSDSDFLALVFFISIVALIISTLIRIWI